MKQGWCSFTRQVCDDGEIQWWDCWTCAKFLSKITYFCLRHGGDLHAATIVERRYLYGLKQGGIEFPTTYIYRYTDMDMHSKLQIIVGETMERYNKARKKQRAN